MKHFDIIQSYDEEDINFYGDPLQVRLVDFSTGKTILEGDWYHDGIDRQIEGFFEALKYLEIKYTKKKRNIHKDLFL